jgi:hypothetical protein
MWPRCRILSCEKWKYTYSLMQLSLAMPRLNRSRSHSTVRKLDANDLYPSITWIHCDLTWLCPCFWRNDVANVFLNVSDDERTRTSDSSPSLHSQRLPGNQYAPNLLERREKFIKEKPTREYLSDEFGIDSFSAGILMMHFDLVVMLNIFHSYDWLSLFDRRSTAYHALSNVVTIIIPWMLPCSRRAFWTLNCYLASRVLP